MDMELKQLISEVKSKGYVCFVRPRLKVIKLHGYKVVSFQDAKQVLKELLK